MEDYGLALVEDINRLLAHLGLASAHIIGYSMGGNIGLKSANLYPEKVRQNIVRCVRQKPASGLLRHTPS